MKKSVKFSLSGDNDVGDDWRFVPPVPCVNSNGGFFFHFMAGRVRPYEVE